MSEPAEKDEFQYQKLDVKKVFEHLGDPVPPDMTCEDYSRWCEARGRPKIPLEWLYSCMPHLRKGYREDEPA